MTILEVRLMSLSAKIPPELSLIAEFPRREQFNSSRILRISPKLPPHKVQLKILTRKN